MARSVARPMIAAGLAVVALVAGCSGDDSESASSTAADWLDSANALCTNAEPVALPADAFADVDRLAGADRERFVDSYQQAYDEAAELTSELSELDGAPSGASALLREISTDTKMLGAALPTGTDAGSAEVAVAGARLWITSNAVAEELDLDDCRDRLGTWSQGTTASAAPLAPDVVCLNAAGFLDVPAAPDADALEAAEPVLCETSHDIDRYLTFEAASTGGSDYPGQVAVAEQAAAQCEATFVEAFGGPAASDPSTYVAVVPDASTWSDGAREITCVRIDPSGERLERSAAEQPAVEE